MCVCVCVCILLIFVKFLESRCKVVFFLMNSGKKALQTKWSLYSSQVKVLRSLCHENVRVFIVKYS